MPSSRNSRVSTFNTSKICNFLWIVLHCLRFNEKRGFSRNTAWFWNRSGGDFRNFYRPEGADRRRRSTRERWAGDATDFRHQAKPRNYRRENREAAYGDFDFTK